MSTPAPRAGTLPAWALSCAVAAGSIWLAVTMLAAIEPPRAPIAIPWWVFAIAFGVAEVAVVHLEFRREVQTFSLSEIPLIIGLFFVHPAALVLARIGGSTVALWFRPGQSWLKRTFNLSHFGFETVIAALVFHAIVPAGGELGPLGWAGAFAAAMAADVTGAFLISAVVSLVSRSFDQTGIGEIVALGAAASFANTGMGLIAVMILWTDARAAWLLVLVATILLLAYRAYASLRRRQESLEHLYRGTLVGHTTDDADQVMAALLGHAREMFRCSWAEMILLDGHGATTRSFLDPDGAVVTTSFDGAADPVIAARVLTAGEGIVAARPVTDAGIQTSLAARGLRDGVVAALRSDSGVTGALVVGNRRNEVQTFGPEDLRLLQTLANHASVAVDNARLIDRLRRQAEENRHLALHDPLTGLANRTLLRTRARQALARAAATGDRVAMLVVDLDRFKEINDTLGHHTGDRILSAVAERFRAAAEDAGTVARLGGDEFAVLVPAVSAEGVGPIAEALVGALVAPFALDDLVLDIGGSIGVAIAPDHGSDPDVLLQRADIAMYVAKEDKSRWEIYDRARDRNTTARLTVVGELRRATAAGEMSLRYQPKVELATGAIVGVEALLRWEHAARGFISPDEFIPLAEQTGLIADITRWVLREAIAQCRVWRAQGHQITVAVNLSARELRDEALPGEIAAMLAEAGVPAEALVLEITESSIMADPARGLAILAALDRMHVGLSVDDFGTGYSSLAQLKRLPASELKMDKSFVMGMLSDDEDAVIVRSTIDLGRNLGKRVVAEGVESAEILGALRALGCDIVQGYHLGRPMDAAQMSEMLRTAPARPARAVLAAV